MLIALTRDVSPSLDSCELTWITREKIDIEVATEQHRQYQSALADLGLHVISLPHEPQFPDSMFVEDPVVVFDELAIIARTGAASRRGEGESLAPVLSRFRPLRRLHAPATLDGGDVLHLGKDVFVGLSSRTNQAGISQLASEIEPFGYRVHAVEVRGCLHLKSACCSIGNDSILANPFWIDIAPFEKYRVIEVAVGEPGAANVLRIRDTVLMPASFPRTERQLQAQGLRTRAIDISELMKAEAAITCCSVIFESDHV